MEAPRRVPDWLLERLAAGELPAQQADELRASLREQGEEGRLTALAASNAEILAVLPAEHVRREVERRASTARKPARPALFALSLAATCAAGLAVFLLVRSPQPGQPGIGPSVGESPEVIGIKGDSLQIHRKTKAGSELLLDKSVVRRGDTLQLDYHGAGKRFGVIASVDARGTVTLHLPETPGPAATLGRGRQNLPHSFELDDAPGFERFVFVASETPFGTAQVAAALSSGKPFPTGSKVFTITLTKETP